MYKITDELNVDGFSINPSHVLIARNQGKRDFYIFNYFVIHIIMKDTEITLENITYKLSKGNIVFISPGQNVVLGAEYEHENSVYVIAFNAPFYERSVNDGLLLNSEVFFHHSSEPLIISSSIPIEEVKKLVIDRIVLYETKKNKALYLSVAHNCIEGLLLDGLFYVKEKMVKKENLKKFTSLDVINKFRILLQKNYKKERQVIFYADQLHMTPRRLTDITETTLGKSAKQVIIEKIVSESIRLLKHSSFTISETAYELGFNDEGNFSTFIKTHTGKTPSEIREILTSIY